MTNERKLCNESYQPGGIILNPKKENHCQSADNPLIPAHLRDQWAMQWLTLASILLWPIQWSREAILKLTRNGNQWGKFIVLTWLLIFYTINIGQWLINYRNLVCVNQCNGWQKCGSSIWLLCNHPISWAGKETGLKRHAANLSWLKLA